MQNADTNVVSKVTGPFRTGFGNALNFIRIVGTGLALIMLTWMAISYFTADGRGFPGAAERQARVKGNQLTNFIIGLIIFIGASNIIVWVSQLLVDIINN